MAQHGEILIIDDDEDSVGALSQMLTAQGFQLFMANSGTEGLEKSFALQPDLILLDIRMPDLDGFIVCEQLKRNPATQGIPVMFISALYEVFDKVHAFQVGAADYITKPFQLEEILARVHTHVRQRKLYACLADKNQALTEMLHRLQETQQQLIEAEKLAALGSMVAGIAHEINTPLGISVTAASTLDDDTATLLQAYRSGHFTRPALEAYFQTAEQSSRLILNNLQRASYLVNSFKQISVDQLQAERRLFNFAAYLTEILQSLEPTLKHSKHQIMLEGSNQLSLVSYPGALSQIITNLVLNSIKHAYPAQLTGILTLRWYIQENQFTLQYSDNGCGIAAHHLHRIFEPFFTTARGRGGTGLGLHIVYSLVTQQLSGQITCESQLGAGTTFTIKLPVIAPMAKFREEPKSSTNGVASLPYQPAWNGA